VSAPRRPGDDGRPGVKKTGWAKAKPKIGRTGKPRVRRDGKPASAVEGDRAEKTPRVRKDGSVASGRSDVRSARAKGTFIDTAPTESKRARPSRRDETAPAGRPDERPRPAVKLSGDRPRPTPVRNGAARPARRDDAQPFPRPPADRSRARPSPVRPNEAPAPKPRAAAAAPAERARPARVRKDGSVAAGSRVAREVRAETAHHASREPQRIAKLLARAGIASRREIERMIVEGRIALSGTVLDTPATILTSLAGVTVDGQPVGAVEASRLFLFHKPTGLITAAFDPAGRATIYDRLPPGLPRVIPVGRLDLNTEGLLLLTNDGELKRKLELPSTGIPRVYRARAYGDVTQDMLESLMDGVTIDGIRYGPIDANLERRTGANVWIEIKITEGKNREVRRVLEYLGLQVSRLIRTAYGEFVLADLPAGEVVEVRQHDLEEFRKTIR
jgi:23S rRNA pseudouridine2605 synthase